LGDGIEEDAAGAVDPFGWVHDALEIDLDVLAGEGAAIVELNTLPKIEGVGHAVSGDIPPDRKVRQDLGLIMGIELE